jgi:hypothetical protein
VTPEERERTRRYVERLDRQRASLALELEEEIAALRGLTLEERGSWVASVCRSAWSILRSRGDLADPSQPVPESPAADFEQLWRRLMARQRAARRSAS